MGNVRSRLQLRLERVFHEQTIGVAQPGAVTAYDNVVALAEDRYFGIGKQRVLLQVVRVQLLDFAT